MTTDRPDWLDEHEYPFRSRFLRLPAGRMHYVDEGAGEPLVMVHGNPDWSFAYRHLIAALSPRFRCVAVDHLGFGLSDKPTAAAPTPADHAANFAALLDHLALTDITLVVNDWGGPFTLPFAVAHPDRVRRLVLINTAFWSVGRWEVGPRLFSLVMGGPLGRWLVRRHHFLVNGVMRRLVRDPACRTDAVWRHYRMPAADPAHRLASASLPRQIVAAGPWFDRHWAERGRLAGKPVLVVWGERDPVLPRSAPEVIARAFPRSRIVRFPDVGHYPHEERPAEVAAAVAAFMAEG